VAICSRPAPANKNKKNQGRLPVKSLLYPAVSLMNRLSFGMKFSLISVLFLVPMLVTNFYLVRDSYREFQGTRVELQSLDLLGSSLTLRRDLETLNNLVQIDVTLGQSGKAGNVEAQIQTLEQAVLARLEGLTAMTEDPEQIKQFEAKRDEMIVDRQVVGQCADFQPDHHQSGRVEPRQPERHSSAQRTGDADYPQRDANPRRRPGDGLVFVGPGLSQQFLQHAF
jgi:hypothetical protein